MKIEGQIRSMRNLLIKILNYPTPSNLNYFWNFGSMAMFCLMIQIFTGILLTFWYIPSVNEAFVSVANVMDNVNNGIFFRYIHANGASLYFFIIFIHMLRGFYYGSYTYPRELVWYTGFLIFLLSMAAAFFGYVLPWGQMSFWAATVITSLVSSIPLIGPDSLIYLWGHLSVDQPLLNRVYVLHFILPFIILILVFLHIVFLHQVGSNNPLGFESRDNISFHPFYTVKDIFGIFVLYTFFFIFVFFFSMLLLHPDNEIPANPEVTPLHIVPEWYFLLFYGILRSIPSKRMGIIMLIGALLVIALLPIISKPVIRSGQFRPIFKYCFWLFISNCIILSWTAAQPVEVPYYEIGQITTILFFIFFLVIIPGLTEFEYFIISNINKDRAKVEREKLKKRTK